MIRRISLALGLFLASSLAHAVVIDRIVATVNNDVILDSDVSKFTRTMKLREQLDPVLGFDTSLPKSPSRKDILQFLIQERLLVQSFKVPDSEVEQEIQSVIKSAGVSTREDLDAFLKKQGFTPSEYNELMAIGLAKRSYIDRELRQRINISNEDVRNEAYKSALKTSAKPLQYKIQIIVIDPSKYDTPKDAQDKAQQALRSIRQGEPFDEVARRVSDAPSKENGGLIDEYFTSQTLQAPLPEVVKKLQIGGVSEVLKTSNGYVIAKLVDAKTSESSESSPEMEAIRQRLAKVEYNKQLYLWTDRARNNAYVKIND